MWRKGHSKELTVLNRSGRRAFQAECKGPEIRTGLMQRTEKRGWLVWSDWAGRVGKDVEATMNRPWKVSAQSGGDGVSLC